LQHLLCVDVSAFPPAVLETAGILCDLTGTQSPESHMREVTFYTFSDSGYLETLNRIRNSSGCDASGAKGPGDWEFSHCNVAFHTAASAPRSSAVEPCPQQRAHVRIHVLHLFRP
jgi:hypothetical protein